MSNSGSRRGLLALSLAAGVLVAACSDDDPDPVLSPPAPPGAVLSLEATTRGDTVKLTWLGAAGAASYRAELAGGPSKDASGLEAVFTRADGLQDGTTYTATVVAIGAGGETPGAQVKVKTNFFPWDENFATSLHATGQGKQTYYNASPNAGLQVYTGIDYDELQCKTCHLPQFTGGCKACHATDAPQLGATVDASLSGACGKCHSRQKAEAANYTDVHRSAGMQCMDCHTMEDLHGDGTSHASMLESDAIDPKCENCHKQVENHLFHSSHADDMDCAVCHTQSVVTCYNCHFETEVFAKKKIPYGQFKDWNFLINRDGKIHLANFQSVKWQDKTVIGWGPFYAHTISRNAVKSCGDCHDNPAVAKWFEDGAIDVVTWNESTQKLTHRTGFIPVPPNYDAGGMLFDFVDLDKPAGSVWSFLERGPDRAHMPYGTPLTRAQMEKLR